MGFVKMDTVATIRRIIYRYTRIQVQYIHRVCTILKRVIDDYYVINLIYLSEKSARTYIYV